MRKAHLCVFIFSLFVVLISACRGPKETVYFRKDTPPDTAMYTQEVLQRANAVIQPNDVLAINIASPSFVPDDKPSLVFLNGGLAYTPTGGVASSGGGGNTSSVGSAAAGANSYLVDSGGYIDYPRIGRLKMAGLTIAQAKVQLCTLLKDYLKSPVVEVRIVNYRITMLGEVGSPGPIYSQNHKINIVDAISMAGGIPIYGRKDNILVIREVEGKREFARLDLNSKNVFNSPYYYLHQNDIVYVEPSNVRKQQSNEFIQVFLPSVTGALGLVASIFAIVTLAKQ